MPELKLPDGHHITYDRLTGTADCGVVFLCGFKSDRQGAKGLMVEEFCRTHALPCVRFDYFGHGESSGAFAEGTITRWRDDAVAVLDQLTAGPQILVGSSMGGWLMLLVALLRPERVAGLMGIAAAPDFSRELIADALTVEQQALLTQQGFIDVPNCHAGGEAYRITGRFLADGDRHLVLRAPLAIHCPVRLLQGLEDRDVPWTVAVRLLEQLATPDARLHLVKDAGHRLSRPQDLAVLRQILAETVQGAAFDAAA
jgi:pimeloyl-ACP methyl ester carboxylesterase